MSGRAVPGRGPGAAGPPGRAAPGVAEAAPGLAAPGRAPGVGMPAPGVPALDAPVLGVPAPGAPALGTGRVGAATGTSAGAPAPVASGVWKGEVGRGAEVAGVVGSAGVLAPVSAAGAGRGPGRKAFGNPPVAGFPEVAGLGAGAVAAAGSSGAALEDDGAASLNFSRILRSTGGCSVDDGDLTNSPESFKAASKSLLVIPSSFASADTRMFTTFLLSWAPSPNRQEALFSYHRTGGAS